MRRFGVGAAASSDGETPSPREGNVPDVHSPGDRAMPLPGRRNLVRWSSASAALAVLPVRAAERRRVGLLEQGPRFNHFDRLVTRMGALGWSETNVEYVREVALPSGLPDAARALAARRPEVVLAIGDYTVRSARQAMPDVPIVMAGSSNPIGLGWVDSMRRPGGRITGTAWSQDAEITGKYVELAAELVPGLTRLGAVIDAAYPGIERYRPALDVAARRLGIATQYVDLPTPQRIDEVFATLRAARMQAAFVFGSPVVYNHASQVASAALTTRMPTIHIFRHLAEAGAAVSYGPSWPSLVVRAVDFVDRILRGADPAELPVEQPTTYELILNLRTLSAIGLKVPPTLLARADEVIE